MSFFADVVVGADFVEVDQAVATKKEEVRRANLAMMTAIRQTAQAGILVLQASGAAVDQVFTLYVEALLVGIEVAAAVAAGTFGFTAVAQIGMILLMIMQIRQIKAKQAQASLKTGAAINLIRLGTFRWFYPDIAIIIYFWEFFIL